MFFFIAAAAALDAAVAAGAGLIRFLPDVILDDADGVDGDADADVDADASCATKLSMRDLCNAAAAAADDE